MESLDRFNMDMFLLINVLICMDTSMKRTIVTNIYIINSVMSLFTQLGVRATRVSLSRNFCGIRVRERFDSFPMGQALLRRYTIGPPRPTPTPLARPPEPRLSLTFTCTVSTCFHRSTHEFSKASYERGIVLVQCPGCKNR